MPRYIEAPELSPNEALFVLESALAEQKITKDDIRRYRYELSQEIARLESRISSLSGAEESREGSAGHRKVAKAPKKTGGDPPFPRKRRPMKTTPERAASMKLQGKYIALLHRVGVKNRAKFQKIAKTEGRDKAIEALELTK